MLQRISVTPPLGDGRVRSRRCVPVADGTGVTRLNEAQCTATLLIAEIAGALVCEQRRFLRISPTASATHQAQLRLDLAAVLRRPVLVGAARWRRQSHRLQSRMVRVLLQERLHQRARHLDLAAPFHVQRHQPIPVHAAAQTWSRYWKQANRWTSLAATFYRILANSLVDSTDTRYTSIRALPLFGRQPRKVLNFVRAIRSSLNRKSSIKYRNPRIYTRTV